MYSRMLSFDPSRTNARKETALPSEVWSSTLKSCPAFTELKTLKELAILTKARRLIEDPDVLCMSNDIDDPNTPLENTEMLLPIRLTARKDTALPRLAKFSTDRLLPPVSPEYKEQTDPIRKYDRNDMLLPKLKKSRTEMLLPIRTCENNDNPDPKRATDRTDILLASCVASHMLN
jgi:hypothetical protein